MFSIKSSALIAMTLCAFVCLLEYSSAQPTIGYYTKRFDSMGGIDFIQMCLNNCVQCKKMFGDYFHGQSCAEACLKFRGKSMPDCEDISSVGPLLKTFE